MSILCDPSSSSTTPCYYPSSDITSQQDVDQPIHFHSSTSPPSPSLPPPPHPPPSSSSSSSSSSMTKSSLISSSFAPPLPRSHSTSTTASPAYPSHCTPHRKTSTGSLDTSIGEEGDETDESWQTSSSLHPPPPPPCQSQSTHTTPVLQGKEGPPPSGPQSTPSISRRLGQSGFVYRGKTLESACSLPPSPPHSHPLYKPLSSSSSPAVSTTSSYHHLDREVPLAPHPSFSLQHRHHHLAKFLSSPLGTALLLNKLRSGSIFLKHGARGSPHYRFLFISDDLAHLHYSELKAKHKIKGSLEVKAMIKVEEGHCSATFARSRSSDPLKSFSIVAEGRTLDLECLSEEDREMWVIAFSFLIEFTKRGGVGGEKGIDMSSIPTSLSLVSALELLCEQNHTLAQSKVSPQTQEERKEERDETLPYPQSSPSLIHASPSSSIRVSHVNRFEVIDIIDESLPAPPPHHLVSSLSLSSPSLSLPASAFDDPRLVRLARDLEQYKEDNKRLLVSHAKKMIRLQKEIDGLMEMNRKLRGMKTKMEKTKKSAQRDCAGSEGELGGAESDESDE